MSSVALDLHWLRDLDALLEALTGAADGSDDLLTPSTIRKSFQADPALGDVVAAQVASDPRLGHYLLVLQQSAAETTCLKYKIHVGLEAAPTSVDEAPAETHDSVSSFADLLGSVNAGWMVQGSTVLPGREAANNMPAASVPNADEVRSRRLRGALCMH